MRAVERVVVLTGAGVSAESGLKTFRGADGLWEGHRVEDVATPEAFVRDPEQVLRFYNERHEQLLQVAPNPAHLALARFERDFKGEFLLVTQNIDDLHGRAGSRRLVHMHGELLKNLCTACGCGAGEAGTSRGGHGMPLLRAAGKPAAPGGLVWRAAAGAGPHLSGAGGLRPVHGHRHFRPCLSCRRLRAGGQSRRRPLRGTQPGAFGGGRRWFHGPVP